MERTDSGLSSVSVRSDASRFSRPDVTGEGSRVSAGRVLCDVCPTPAVKTCLTCGDSYCMTCIRPHYSDPDLERHQLQDLQDQSLCQQHHKQLKFYCWTDQSAICSRCLLKDHMRHDVVEQLPSPRGQIQFPSVQPHSVTLRWSPPEGAPGPHRYRVTWRRGQEQRSIVVAGSEANMTGLLPGEKYQFAVVTLSEDGRQSPCVRASVHTEIPVPERLTVSSITASSASLSWLVSPEMEQTPHSFLVSYQSEGTELKSISTGSSSTDITGLKPVTDYTVKVYTELQHGGKSQPASEKIKTDIPVPERLTVSSITASSASLSWLVSPEMKQTPHSFLVSYQSEGTEPKSISTGSCSTDITGLKPGTEYTVKVYTELQHGGKSQPASVQMETVHPEIPVPERLTVSSITASSASFSWLVSPEMKQTPHSFLVSYQTEGTELKSISTGSCSTVITGLKRGTHYTVRVYTQLQHGGKSQPASVQMKTRSIVPEASIVRSVRAASTVPSLAHHSLMDWTRSGLIGHSPMKLTQPGLPGSHRVWQKTPIPKLQHGQRPHPYSVTKEMAPVSMQAPVCLIDNGTDGRMSVQQGALQILEQIQEPVVVVAVVGLYRTGKSYLMNRLAGKQKGFALGSTIESKTKGIWMWCVPHPSKPGNTIVLLDTEGLGDVDKGDPKHDPQLFTLAVLLSSSLIYNSRGTIDNKAVKELQFVTELTEFIKVKSCDEDGDDSEFVKFFPSFIWAVRDFTLERKIEGKDVTEDEYLDFALKLKAGHSKKVNDYNLPRECIRKYFPCRKCFTFPPPTRPENMIRMESLAPSELAPAFLEVADRFCSFVFDQSPVKQLKDGHAVDGRILGHMVKMYVEIFSRGDVPCLENAVLAMAQLENEAAVKEGLEVYESGMEQLKANFPVDLKDITSGHQRLTSLATEIFMKRSFKDDDGKHMKSLEEAVDKLFSRFLLQNEDASVLICQEILAGLSAPLKNKLQQGFYTKVGGYQLFCQDMEEIVVKYNSQSHRGEKAEDVLQEFMKQRREESAAILQADQSLSVKDREICAEREKAVLLEQEMRLGQEAQRQLEERMEAQRQSSEERMRQVMDKMQQELKQQQEEERRARESMLREQALLLEKGFKEKADVMTREIEESRRKAEAAQEAKSQEFTRLIEQQDRRHDDVMSLMKQQQEAMMEQQEAMMKKVIPISCCIL